MRAEGEAVAQRQGSGFLAQSSVARLVRKLRRRSPIRIWLERRSKNAATGSASALINALEDPHSAGWIDRAVGYQALGEVELSPQERRRAGELLMPALTPPERQTF